MAKDFRRADRAQTFLLPPDMRDWLPEGHLVWFLLEVLEELDLSRFEATAKLGAAGRAPFDPSTLLGILIYGYAHGQRSSRQLERLCEVDVAFRVLAGNEVPDHTTLARFRQRHETALIDLFTQVLMLCARAGLGRLGVVAIDGTKIAANASAQANRSEQALREQLRRQAEEAMAEAAATDAAEDEEFGDARGDELAREWRAGDRASRIRAALHDLERERDSDRQQDAAQAATRRRKAADYDRRRNDPTATPAVRRGAASALARVDKVAAAEQRLTAEVAHAERRARTRAGKQAAAEVQGRKLSGPAPLPVAEQAAVRRAQAKLEAARRQVATPPQAPSGGPSVAAKRVRNITDPDSRLMPTAKGWVQGFNAQLAVSDDQIILAARLVQHPNDVAQYIPTVAAAEAATELMNAHREGAEDIGVVVADAGYLSTANLTAPGPQRLIAVGSRRQLERDAREPSTSGPPTAHADPRTQMQHRLKTPEATQIYRRRGVTVEPVNGHLKDGVGLRRFSRRGLQAAASELQLAATVVNLLKLHRAQPA
jgi:transposase